MAGTQRKSPELRRQEIIVAARRILVKEGHHRLTMRHLADAVGLQLSSVQYHFSTRERLLEALMKDTADNYNDKLAAYTLELDHLPVERQVDPVLTYFLSENDKDDVNGFFIQLEAMAIEEPRARDLIDGFYRDIWHLLADHLLRQNPELSPTERKLRAALMVSLVEGSAIFLASPALSEELPKAFKRRIKALLVDLITRP